MMRRPLRRAPRAPAGDARRGRLAAGRRDPVRGRRAERRSGRAGAAIGHGDGDRPFSDVLRQLPRRADGEDGPRLGEVRDRLGARVHGAVILLLALPEALPIPLPSAGAVLGIPLILVSAHLAIFGERGTLPARVLAWRLPVGFAAFAADRLAPIFARIERISRARLAVLAGKERPVGVACLLLSALLFLPIPFMNIPPAIGLAVLSWGLIQRDGLIVAAGLGYAAAILILATLGALALAEWIR